MQRLRSKIALCAAEIKQKSNDDANDSNENTSSDNIDRSDNAGIGYEYRIVPALAAILPHDVSSIKYDTSSSDVKKVLPMKRNKQRLSPKHPEYSAGLAILLELLQEENWSIKDTANKLHMSTSALSKMILKDYELKAVVNRARQKNDMKPLK